MHLRSMDKQMDSFLSGAYFSCGDKFQNER